MTDEKLLGTLRLSEQVLATALGWFEDVYAVMGNHDRRLNLALGGQLGPYRLLQLPNGETVKVNVYSYLYLNTSRGPVMVVHPRNYSKLQLAIPQDLVTIEPERCHVISTHTHHCCSGFDKSGRWQVVEAGCLRDPVRTLYRQVDKTRYPALVPGFAMIKDGYIHTFPKHATPWLLWLGPELYAEVFGESQAAVAEAA